MSNRQCVGIGLILVAAFWGWMVMPLFVLPFAVCWLALVPFSGKAGMEYSGSLIGLLSLLCIMSLMGFTAYALLEFIKEAA